jgi:hypothetical protein
VHDAMRDNGKLPEDLGIAPRQRELMRVAV